MLNRNIDSYEITQEVGSGHAAKVYVARQQPVGRYVALKVFDHLTLDSTARLKQLFDQVEAIDHVNILPLYASGSIDDHAYWVMRYLSAGSLPSRTRVPLDQAQRWLAQIASALDYAHEHDLIHGGLKPSNVLIDHAGHAFVCDFGLAQIVGASPDDYVLPEGRRDFKPDVKADIYALGALAYELLTGRAPISSALHTDDQSNRRTMLPPLPSSLNNKLSPAIDAAIMKALSIDPEQRYASAAEFVEALSQASGTVAPVTTETKTLDQVAVASTHRVRTQRTSVDWRWIAGGIVGLLILIGLIGLLSSQSSASVAPSISASPVISTATSIALPTATLEPTATPTRQPSLTPTPTVSTSAIISATPIVVVPVTRVPTLTVRATPTPSVTIIVQPLALLMPRRENSSRLELFFSTHVAPEDSGPIGSLSLSIPAIEPLIIDRGFSQVGSGEQTVSAAITIDCKLATGPIETQQVTLIIQAQNGRVIFSQVIEYRKTWCE
jgi:serine/threonine protein kinase